MKTMAFTVLALMAFAANSVLCRIALGEGMIDAATFTVVRLVSGITMLMIILAVSPEKRPSESRGNWVSALMLFLYAISFSYAYLSLDTRTGALVLFGAVQITMIFISLRAGNRLHLTEWIGVGLAFIGLAYLVLPSVTTPSFLGFILMSIAGIAWAVYTLRGKNSTNPLGETAWNFARTLPMIITVAVVAIPTMPFSYEGLMLAILSGAVASGLGYMVWYHALCGLSATEAAVVQLSVPMIAAIGSVVFVSEAITARLVYSGVLILGGILIVVLGRQYLLQLRA